MMPGGLVSRNPNDPFLPGVISLVTTPEDKLSATVHMMLMRAPAET
jgi:hypothetical protein